MKEIGKVRVFQDGVSIKKGYEEPVIPLAKGTDLPFATSFTLNSGPHQELSIRGSTSGNGLEIRHIHNAQVTFPDSPLALPAYTDDRVTREIYFGHTPGNTSATFGHPEPGIEITYSGHPLHKELEPYMDAQKADFNPQRELIFTDNTDGALLFGGKVVNVNAYGFDKGELTEYNYAKEYTPPSKVYPGEMMLGATVQPGYRNSPPEVTLFAAVKTAEDTILRVKTHEYTAYLKHDTGEDHYNASRMVDELAVISVLGHELDAPKYTDLRESFSLRTINRLGNEMSRTSRTGIPDVEGVTGYLNVEGVDWRAVREELPKDDIREETHRLADVLRVEYAAARPAPLPKKRGRRTVYMPTN